MNLSNYGWWLPVQASTYAAKIDQCLNLVHIAMAVIFGLWAIYMVYCLVRYRQKSNPVADYAHKATLSSYTPDVVILIFEIWLIFVVGLPIWAHVREEMPKPENATVVDVVAEQYSWTFHYPGPDGKFGKTDSALINASNALGLDPNDPDGKDDVISVNELYIPIGKPVLVNLTSKDVIHSFFVPEFRSKQDVVPGMRIPFWVEPTMTGQFEIGCAQLCGAGHYRMRADVFVQTQADFDAWISSRQAKGI